MSIMHAHAHAHVHGSPSPRRGGTLLHALLVITGRLVHSLHNLMRTYPQPYTVFPPGLYLLMSTTDAAKLATCQGHVLLPWQPCYGDNSLSFAECWRCGEVMQARGDVLVPYDWPLLREACPGQTRALCSD
jgi:hypothetical protein